MTGDFLYLSGWVAMHLHDCHECINTSERFSPCNEYLAVIKGEDRFMPTYVQHGHLSAYKCDFGDHWHVGHVPTWKSRMSFASISG